MRISRKLQACLTIKQSRESIFRGFDSGAFFLGGGLPSFLVLIPNTNPLWLDDGGNVHPLFRLCIFLSKGQRKALLSLWSPGPLDTDAY